MSCCTPAQPMEDTIAELIIRNEMSRILGVPKNTIIAVPMEEDPNGR